MVGFKVWVYVVWISDPFSTFTVVRRINLRH
jgi:hypothetical protein